MTELDRKVEQHVDHVLLTRFNLPSEGFESMVRDQDGWLADRQQLFERYCLPSVRAQTNNRFRWLIYFDPASPAWLRSRVRQLSEDGLFRPIYRSSVSAKDLVADLQDLFPNPSRELITTNLDNDDAIAVDFVDRLQRVRPDGARAAIYLATGLIKCGGRTYLRRDPSNAFCSVREHWRDPATCWADWHNSLGRQMPVITQHGPPAWLQVIHGGNVSNRIRGSRVDPEPYRDLFGGRLDDVPTPARHELLIDHAAAVPLRVTIGAGRQIVKTAVLAIGGRDGLDQAKRLLGGGKR